MYLRVLILAGGCLFASNAISQEINFGDDSGEYAIDGVCDDRRFEGPGMEMGLSWLHVGADATDCSSAVDAGTASLWNLPDGVARTNCTAIDFGNDESEFSFDGACDDPRFEGPGAAELPSVEFIGSDASDCKNLCTYDLIFLRELAPVTLPEEEVIDDFYGDNSGEYSRDGECDDRRFVGEGMADRLGWESTGRDADDCRIAFEVGDIALWDQKFAAEQTICSEIDFGEDASEYARDGTCDDKRFEGRGAASVISSGYVGQDATDCSRMCDYGMIFVRDTE